MTLSLRFLPWFGLRTLNLFILLLLTASLLMLPGLTLHASGQALTITGLSPARNARSAPTTTNVSVTFDKPLSNLSSSLSGLSVFSARRGGLLVNGRGGGVSVSGSTMIFNPTTDFRPGETVFVTGTTTIQGSDGSRLNRGQVYGFTTGVGGDGQGNFIRQASNPMLAVGQLPYGLALGDVDGDGDLDFVTASGRNDVVGVWLNNGSGNFAPPATNPNPGVGLFPVSVVLGDVDGDGDLDLLCTNQISNTVSVRLNNGSGNFTPPATNPNPVVGSGPTNVALGDLDGDGDLDFVTANGGGTVSVRLNNGLGNFTPPATNPEPEFTSGVNSVALGDVDGDGDLDFVTANDNGTASVRLNDGSGNFTPPATNPNPGVGSAPRTVVLGDVDGDGDLDLLTANYSSSTVSVRLNNGSGNFIPPANNLNPGVRNGTWGMALGDVDGDGDLDFVTANDASGNVSIRLNNGSGNFTPPATNPNPMMSDPGNNGKNPQSVALGDVDGDGDLDLLCINRGSSDMMVRINKTFPPPTLTPIRYVRAGASGSGNSWADASGDLQSQINFTGAQQVWVAAGTYKPGPAGNTNRTSSFSMKDGVAIYGGFAGTETSLSERVLTNPLTTILSGDIGTAGNSADNSYHVINNPPGLFNSAVLDGFFITGGNANASSSPNDGGGGMLNNSSGAGNICTPLISNCLFAGNSATTAGGALYNAGFTNGNSSPTLINCAFQGNTAGQGGAIFNDGSVGGISSPGLINCSFQANSAGSGGAMSSVAYQGTSRPTLTNSVVWGNGGSSTFSNQQGALITTSYNLFESSVTGYSPGTGNLTTTTSPFLSATSTQLNGCSPALNSGDNAAYTTPGDDMPPTTDLAGNARVFPSGGRIDMGAYEYQTAEGLAVSVPSVNKATLGLAFSQPFTATGGTSPYSYSLASGSLPTGLSLASTGVLSGTPTQVGSFTITVKATNATGCSGVSAPYGLTVDPGSPIRYVRAGASGSGNSWADASGDLQRQINFAGAQQVWVAQGTYKPTTGTDRTVSFSMKNGVAIYGGFAGTETALAQRSPTSLTTVLSGNIGNAGSNTDNTYHVFSHPKELALNNTAVLDGFVIRDGYDNDQTPSGFYGGGMYNDNSSPTIANCSFLDNTSFLGGGMYNNGTSNPGLTNCSFRSNTAINTGGGMENNGTSNPMLTNCSFVGNRARFGGGMGNDYSSIPTLTNCSFVSNTASDTGGGMFNGNSNPVLINCSFLSNSSVNRGGGIYNQDSNPTLTNCVLFGNGGANTFSSRTGFSVTYSLLEPAVMGYTSSPTNLITTVSPFVSATDASINGCSPAINAGLNSANTTTRDLAGNPRLYQNGRIDMGAYEYQAAPTSIIPTAPGVSTATVGVAFSQTFTVSGGSGPYSYSLASGSLPTGLNLASTGTLSGTPTQSGSFTLTVKATDANGCSGVSAAYVLTVTDAASTSPTLSGLNASRGVVCAGIPVTFTATVGNVTDSYSYTLTNGMGTSLSGTSTSSTFSQSVTAAGTGSQTFTLTISANGQSASSVTTLTVSPLPVASLTNNGPLSCAQTSVTLTASGGSSYTFTSGSGVLGTPGPINTLVVSSAGTYSVTVANASGCTSTTSVMVQSNTASPTNVSLTSGTLTCTSTSATLTASSTGGTSYTLSDGQTSASGSFVVSTPSTYTVITSGPNGCTASATATVASSTATPEASLSASSPTACAPASGPPTAITLTAGGGTSYTFSAGTTQLGMTNQAIVTQSGTYSVTVSNATGCTATASVSVTVNTPPAAPTLTLVSRTVDQSNTPLLLGQFVQATGSNTLSFSGVTGALNPPTANVSQVGVQSFSVSQTNASGCVSPATVFTITVQQRATTTPGSQTVCRSSAVVLSATTTGTRYEWYKNGQSAPFKLTEIASIQKGTATSSLTLVSVQTTASYYCKVFQASGESTPGSFTFDGPFVVTVNYGCVAPGGRQVALDGLTPAESVETGLQIVLLPNPLTNGRLRAVISGAEGQPLSVELLDLRGMTRHQQQWETATPAQAVEWDVSQQPAGVYLLRAVSRLTNGTTQRQTLKVLKTD